MWARENGEDDVRRVVAWLGEHAQPGDLVLTACADALSATIRWGTNGTYSHVVMVLADRRVIEAYDRTTTLRDDNEGVFELTFEQFARRGRLRQLLVLRPDSEIDLDALHDLAERALTHSPRFASLAAVAQAGFGLTAPRWLPASMTRTAWAERRIGLVADGPERVHCAEFVTRLYVSCGFTPQFEAARLAAFFGHVCPTIAPLRLDEPRRADERDGSDTTHSAAGPLALARQAKGVAARTPDHVRMVRHRSRRDPDGDIADLVMPADLERSPSFRTVSRLAVRTRRPT